MLDQLIPTPRLLDLDHVDVAAPPERVWARLRHGELAPTPVIRALFALRTLPDRRHGKPAAAAIRLDDLTSSPERPGFQLLGEDPPHEFIVGAIGQVWQPEIPFVHVQSAPQFTAFEDVGYIKVGWAIRVAPRGERDSRVEFELRVDATDEESWRKFKRYFRVIGPASHFIRRSLLASVVREFGTPDQQDDERAIAGDELLPNALEQLTHGITIAAPPERIWPWLLQMGCRRAGFYSIDLLDNAGIRSARELHPELQRLEIGQVLPATPDGDDGFEVLSVQPPRALVLGGLYDAVAGKQLAFNAPRPLQYWQVTWAFELEQLDGETTRLRVRARAAFSASERLHAAAIRPVHHLMQSAMLRHLAARAEGRLPRDDLRDIGEGIGGAAIMVAALFSPFLRDARSHWGLDETTAARPFPGDELVPAPYWSWTHGVTIDAPASEVWPWVAQIGADRAGFYSYQWLENLIGCELRNAETIHPEWEVRAGEPLQLHPDPSAPRLLVTSVVPGSHFVAHGPPDNDAREHGRPWVTVSWLFLVEPLADGKSRFISRYRADCSDDLRTRLSYGPILVEPVGFAMDRRMLLGVKQRCELAHRTPRLAAAPTEAG